MAVITIKTEELEELQFALEAAASAMEHLYGENDPDHVSLKPLIRQLSHFKGKKICKNCGRPIVWNRTANGKYGYFHEHSSVMHCYSYGLSSQAEPEGRGEG